MYRRVICASVLIVGVAGMGAPSLGAAVKGSVELPSAVSGVGRRTLGHTRTRLSGPAASAGAAKERVALFLSAKNSLPLPEPEAPESLQVIGLGLEPSVASCPVDGKVTLTNHDQRPVTIRIEGRVFAVIKPGESASYECTAGPAGGAYRSVKIDEWPHIRGWIYVGEVGVAGSVQEDGQFRLPASEGTFSLYFLGDGSVLTTKDVTIGRADVDVGKVVLLSPGPAPGAETTGAKPKEASVP
ncbi:MAG: hypothetical protein IPK13_15310 [Deltaproteobacteria bacterium]|nr:hypothetical protein [Deltaproteobacteria bacterium]